MANHEPPANRLLLVSTIGNRDLTLDGRPIPPEQFRATCEALYRELQRDRESTLSRLDAPILERLVTWILDRHADPDERPQLRIYLVASDQEDEQFRASDTIAAARLLQEWIPHAYGRDTIERVAIWRIDTNPADYDDAVRFYRLLIGQRAVPDPRAFAVAYLNPTGGTPALAFGLLTVLAPFFGERAIVVYLPARTRRPTPMDVGAAFRQHQALDDAARALQRWDFAHAAELLRVALAPLPLVAFADVLAYRAAFDFRRALHRLEGTVIPASRGSLRQLARTEQETLARLLADAEALDRASEPCPDRYPALLVELYGSALVAWEQERYADFLARVFRLEEAALRWAVERCLALPTGSERDEQGRVRSLPAFRAGIAGDSELAQHLARSPFDPDRPPSRDLLRHLLAVPRLASDPVAQATRTASAALDALSQLRNRSIVAHGFAPVSREEIEARCADPLAALGQLVAAAGHDPATHPLAASRDGLLAELART